MLLTPAHQIPDLIPAINASAHGALASIQALTNEVGALRRENAALTVANESLRKFAVGLGDDVSRLQAGVTELAQRVGELLAARGPVPAVNVDGETPPGPAQSHPSAAPSPAPRLAASALQQVPPSTNVDSEAPPGLARPHSPPPGPSAALASTLPLAASHAQPLGQPVPPPPDSLLPTATPPADAPSPVICDSPALPPAPSPSPSPATMPPPVLISQGPADAGGLEEEEDMEIGDD